MVVQKNSYRKKTDQLTGLKLDLNSYDLFCRYILQENRNIRIEHLVALRTLIFSIPPENYENDPELVKRVNFIKKGLEARIDNNLNDRDIVLNYITGGITFKIDFLDYDRLLLSQAEIEYVTNYISDTLKWDFIYSEGDNLLDLLTQVKMSDNMSKQNLINALQEKINYFHNKFRTTNFISNATDMVFSLENGNFENCLTETYNMMANPSRRLMTGMQGLNEMIGGGFESGRVYMFLGTSGIGKSKLLLNLMYQIKIYNRNYVPKDPSKKPAIVMLTMENTVVETITRLWDLVMGGETNMTNYSIDEVVTRLRTEGQLFVSDASPIDFIIKYKPNKSVDTSYLYTLCDEFEDQGKEVICIIQDHVKRIRSIDKNTDVRLELGDVVNEMKSFAAIKDIPVITCSHLNRDAARSLEEAEGKKNQDTGKLLGKSNVGESMLMIDNLDFGIIITLDYDKEERLYMAFNAVKVRAKTNRTYIVQPFVPGNSMRLVEDVGGIPQFKESIHTQLNMNMVSSSVVKISGVNSMIENMSKLMPEDNSTFTKKSYDMNEEKEVPPRKIIKPFHFINENMGNIIQDIKMDIEDFEED